MSRHIITATLVLSVLLIALAFYLQPAHEQSPIESHENPTMPLLNLTYHARTNDSTDVLRVSLETANPHVTARVLIEDPSTTPAKTLRAVNVTADRPRDMPLGSLPPLVRVRGVIEQPGTSVLTKWIWRGNAHVIIADSPRDLAAALEATP